MDITFKKSEVKELAIFLAELIRQGIVFKTYNNNEFFLITFTGGF